MIVVFLECSVQYTRGEGGGGVLRYNSDGDNSANEAKLFDPQQIPFFSAYIFFG